MLLIGDVHGLVNQYWQLMQRHKPAESIQLGDFGFRREHDWFLQNMDYSKHKILFGNHDFYPFLHRAHALGVYKHEGLNLFAIRGAKSIDRAQRIEERDWWPEEELTYLDWRWIVGDFDAGRLKPDIIVSHDCPHSVRKQLFGINERSITSDGLQAVFELHQPRLWVFGHHHRRMNEEINGTRFVCLEELGTLEI